MSAHIERLKILLSDALENSEQLTGSPDAQLQPAALAVNYARALAALSPPVGHIVEWDRGAVQASEISGMGLIAANPAFGMVWRIVIDMRGDHGTGRHVLKFDGESEASAEYTRLRAAWRGTA